MVRMHSACTRVHSFLEKKASQIANRITKTIDNPIINAPTPRAGTTRICTTATHSNEDHAPWLAGTVAGPLLSRAGGHIRRVHPIGMGLEQEKVAAMLPPLPFESVDSLSSY